MSQFTKGLWSNDYICMVKPFVNKLKLSHSLQKSRLFCRFLLIFLLVVFNTYLMSFLVDNILNIGQKKTMLVSLINTSKRLLHVKAWKTVFRLKTASFLVVTDWWILIRTKPVYAYGRLLVWWFNLYCKPFC